MERKSFMSAFISCLMIAGMCTAIVSCSKDEAEEEYGNESGVDCFIPEGFSLAGDFVSFVEDGTGVMNHDTLTLVSQWWFVEVGENERYYIHPRRGDFQTALKAVSQNGTKVQFSGKLYALNEEIFKYKDSPDMKIAAVLADLATKYKIYILILPDMEDPDWQKCYIKECY